MHAKLLQSCQTLKPHGLQHARSPCPSPTPGVYLSSCPLSRWCHPTISPSVVLFSSCLQYFLASVSFQISQFFTTGGHTTGVSAPASVLPMNIQDWLLLGLTGWISLQSRSDQIRSVTQLCPTLCDPMNLSTPGLPVHYKLPEFTQTHVHRVSDAIQPSHPLSSPSPPAFNLSQHQGLFQWVSSLHQVAKVLDFQLQPQSFQWTFRIGLL